MDLIEHLLGARASSRAALEAALELGPGEVAWASGSIIEGLGDAGSNIDLFVLTDEAGLGRRRRLFAPHRALQQARRNFGIIYLQSGEMPCDIEVHPTHTFTTLLAEIAGLRLDDPEAMRRSEKSLGALDATFAHELLHRLHIGVPLGDEQAFAQLAERLDVRKYLAWRVHCIDVDLVDLDDGIARNLAAGDPENALFKLREAYHRLADRLICLAGESLDRPKWRLPKLRRIGRPDFLREYLAVQLDGVSRGELVRFVSAGAARARAWRTDRALLRAG